MVFVRKLQNTFCIKSRGYNSFSKVPKSFRSRKDEAKYQTLSPGQTIATCQRNITQHVAPNNVALACCNRLAGALRQHSCFINLPDMTRGPLHTRCVRSIFVFRYRLTKSGFAGPKSFGGFRETSPAMTKQMTVSYRVWLKVLILLITPMEKKITILIQSFGFS